MSASTKNHLNVQYLPFPKRSPPTTEERRIANALGALPCIACYMHGVISEEVSLHHISGRTAPGCHKKQLPLCRWHHQHAAPAEVRAKYPWLVPVHADGVVGGKKEFTLLNKSEMELLADAMRWQTSCTNKYIIFNDK